MRGSIRSRPGVLLLAMAAVVVAVAPPGAAPGAQAPAPASATAAAPAAPGGGFGVQCYHHLDDPAANQFTVTPADFEAQMAWLASSGHEVVSLARIEAASHGRGRLPPRSVAITIDDGWRCANTQALPVLRTRRMPATLFIYPAMVGRGGHKSSWEEYRAMLSDPLVTIGCHSWTHPNLFRERARLSGERLARFLAREYVESRVEIERRLGAPVLWFAYPYGLYDDETAKLVRQAGYRAAFTVNGAPNPGRADPMALNRQMVVRSDGLAGFQRKVSSLALEVADVDPPDGATVSITRRRFAARVVDPRVDRATAKLSVGGRGPGVVDAATGVVALELARPLAARAYQVSVQARDTATGRPRRASWLVRVVRPPSPAKPSPAKPGHAPVHAADEEPPE
jgi:peptidoglycan/xylan/chitin deacetylase (PgdA/CDA1 family)